MRGSFPPPPAVVPVWKTTTLSSVHTDDIFWVTQHYSHNPDRLARHGPGHRCPDSSVPTHTAAPGTTQPRDLQALAERLPAVPAGLRGTGTGPLPHQPRKSKQLSEARLPRNCRTFARRRQMQTSGGRKAEDSLWHMARHQPAGPQQANLQETHTSYSHPLLRPPKCYISAMLINLTCFV